MNKQKETLHIEGMSCHHCIHAVRKTLEAQEGVEIHGVVIGAAEISFDRSKTDRGHLVEAIEDLGYTVHPDQ